MSEVTDVEIATWVARTLGYSVVEKAVLDQRQADAMAALDALAATKDIVKEAFDALSEELRPDAEIEKSDDEPVVEEEENLEKDAAPAPTIVRQSDPNRWHVQGTDAAPTGNGAPTDHPLATPVTPSNDLPSDHPLAVAKSEDAVDEVVAEEVVE